MLIYRMVLTTILLPSRKHYKKTMLRENTTTIVFFTREA